MTLALPPGDVSNVPVVVYQHGLGDDRSAIFAVADALCEQGFAVAAIDIPFHGMRAQGSVDLHHAFGSTAGPDLYGDLTGTTIYVSFVGVVDTTGPYAAFHPTYPRDTLRQGALDVMALVNALDRSDWSGVGSMGGPTTIGFSADPIGFVGVSLGGIVGTTFVTGEPRVGAAVLNVTGGELTNLVAYSGSFNTTFLPLLLPKIGLDPDSVDYTNSPPRFLPEVALYQTLLDRGDAISFGPVLAGQAKNVLFQMAYDDETVPNQATEALARSADATIIGRMPRYSDLDMGTSPLVSNLVLGSSRVTRGLSVFDPATHGLLSTRMSEAVWPHPPTPPYIMESTPSPVMNPVDAAITQMVHFFVTFRSGAAEISQ
jgi:pimeloyl-ACP methyl ester carboxylesterase